VTGDDVVNVGTIRAAGANSTGIASGPYGVIQNGGSIGATGAGSVAVQMNSLFGTLLNAGTITAAPGAFAIQTGPSAVGTMIVNSGVIDGPVSVTAGPFARFQNSGWMGISAPGAGVTHTISGVFAQTSTGTLALRLGNGISDQLLVNGQTRLAGTALASFQPGALSNSYTLVSATGGYSGAFNALATQNLPGFLNASLSYGTNNVSLFLQSSMASTPGLGGNQISVARALDTAFTPAPVLVPCRPCSASRKASSRRRSHCWRATMPASARPSLSQPVASSPRFSAVAPARAAPRSWRPPARRKR
jgi:hypothetical protein